MPLDAAILFSDIMVPVAEMGVEVRIDPGVGPVVAEPLRSATDVLRLRSLDAEEDTPFVLEAIRILREELKVPADRVRRSSVHPGQLPGRGRSVPGPRADQGR